jgi:hypothetical protein
VTVEFLEWGKAQSFSNQPEPSNSSFSNNESVSTNVRDSSSINDDSSDSSSNSSSDIGNGNSSSCDSSATKKNINTNDKEDETFSLVIGTDLLYCVDIVVPLFKSAKQLLKRDASSRFILVSSFNPGRARIRDRFRVRIRLGL